MRSNLKKIFLSAILIVRDQEELVNPERGWQLVTEKLINAGVYPEAEEVQTAWTSTFGEAAPTLQVDLFRMPLQEAYRWVWLTLG